MDSAPAFARLDPVGDAKDNLILLDRFDAECWVLSLFASSHVADHRPMVECSFRFQPGPSVGAEPHQERVELSIAELFPFRGSSRTSGCDPKNPVVARGR